MKIKTLTYNFSQVLTSSLCRWLFEPVNGFGSVSFSLGKVATLIALYFFVEHSMTDYHVTPIQNNLQEQMRLVVIGNRVRSWSHFEKYIILNNPILPSLAGNFDHSLANLICSDGTVQIANKFFGKWCIWWKKTTGA